MVGFVKIGLIGRVVSSAIIDMYSVILLGCNKYLAP
jgi:hypothetical protein